METNKVELKQHLEVKDVIIYLEGLVNGFKEGKIVVQQEENHVVLNLPETATVAVAAKNKKGKASFSLELAWRLAPEAETAKVGIGSQIPDATAEDTAS
jgi:amphi-Trp domain-containing protein